MKLVLPLISALLLVGCASVEVPEPFADDRADYIKGVKDAENDQEAGIRRIAAIECLEEEDWRTLWVFCRLLRERYDVDYNIISPSPIEPHVAYMEGYNSVALPPLNLILGDDWSQRMWVEARVYKQKHWDRLEPEYLKSR